jgi:hypothetical protein
MTHLLMNPPSRNAGNPKAALLQVETLSKQFLARETANAMTRTNNISTNVDAGRSCGNIVRQTDYEPMMGLKFHPICYY